MSKKTIKIIAIVVMAAIAFGLFTATVFAATPSDYVDGGTSLGSFDKIGKNLVATITTIAMIVAVIVLMIIGIKYMIGSTEEKASYKKTMMPYLIGAILVFGVSFVVDFVYDVAIGLDNETAGDETTEEEE